MDFIPALIALVFAVYLQSGMPGLEFIEIIYTDLKHQGAILRNLYTKNMAETGSTSESTESQSSNPVRIDNRDVENSDIHVEITQQHYYHPQKDTNQIPLSDGGSKDSDGDNEYPN